MAEFQDMLKSLLKESGYTIYSLSTEIGIDRSYLSKILSGKRKMPYEIFSTISDTIDITENSKIALTQSYISEIFGNEKFESYFYHLTRGMNDTESAFKTNITEVKDDFLAFNSKLDLFNFSEFFISNKNQSSVLYTNFPVSILRNITSKKENCDFRCIVNSNGKDKYVSIFDLIKLNLLNCTSYIDESGTFEWSKQEFYPYIAISDNSLLFADKKFEKGYYIKNATLADMYKKDFSRICKYLKVNSQIHDDILNVREPVMKYIFNRKIHRVLNNTLSVVAFMSRKDWEELAQSDLPDRGYLINTTYDYYQEFFKGIETHIFISSVSGLDDFCKTGVVHEMPVEYSKPLSIETRIALLEKMAVCIKTDPNKYKLNFLKTSTLEKDEILLTVESSIDPKSEYKATLIAMSASKSQKAFFPGNYLFLSTDKDAIEEYNTFFDLMRISDRMMTNEETLAVIEDRILRLKYNANNVNSALN